MYARALLWALAFVLTVSASSLALATGGIERPRRAQSTEAIEVGGATGGAAAAGDKFGSGLGPPSDPISDVDIHAIELSLMESAMNGDLMGGLRTMLLGFQELQDLWTDTRVFRTVLEGLPILRALKGVDAIVTKDQLTAEEVCKETGECGLLEGTDLGRPNAHSPSPTH